MQCPNLRAAMSLGAGVDHILQPGQVPDHVPILRIVSQPVKEGIGGQRAGCEPTLTNPCIGRALGRL